MRKIDFKKLEIKKADLIQVKGGGKKVIDTCPTGSGKVLDEPGTYCDTLNVYEDGSCDTVVHSC